GHLGGGHREWAAGTRSATLADGGLLFRVDGTSFGQRLATCAARADPRRVWQEQTGNSRSATGGAARLERSRGIGIRRASLGAPFGCGFPENTCRTGQA